VIARDRKGKTTARMNAAQWIALNKKFSIVRVHAVLTKAGRR